MWMMGMSTIPSTITCATWILSRARPQLTEAAEVPKRLAGPSFRACVGDEFLAAWHYPSDACSLASDCASMRIPPFAMQKLPKFAAPRMLAQPRPRHRRSRARRRGV